MGKKEKTPAIIMTAGKREIIRKLLSEYDSFVSDVTDKILSQIQEWQTRPLDEVYPMMFIDATH